MSLLDKLERKFGQFALPNVTAVLIASQVMVYIAMWMPAPPPFLQYIELIPKDVLQGEWWRLFTFLAMPPETNPIFAFFFWYLFFLMGSALEGHWGAFRYNVFLLIGYVATVSVAFIVPGEPANNLFLQGSVFLAFAFLYPDFKLLIFFLLPVKIKWFALITWISYGFVVITGDMMARVLVLASVLNFLLFFHRDILGRMYAAQRRMSYQAKLIKSEPKFYHQCRICKITDQTNPEVDFRYCSKCAGDCCYCQEHLRKHEHVVDPKAQPPADPSPDASTSDKRDLGPGRTFQ